MMPHMGPPPPPNGQFGNFGGRGPMPPNANVRNKMSGTIARYYPQKGYGFLQPDDVDEDIFFLRSELPQELSGAQNHEEVCNRRVEFDVRVMQDNKLRAMKLRLLKDGEKTKPKRSDENLPPLEQDLIDEMVEFLASNGGGCDYGKFSSRFAKVKKQQLKEHFDIFSLDR